MFARVLLGFQLFSGPFALVFWVVARGLLCFQLIFGPEGENSVSDHLDLSHYLSNHSCQCTNTLNFNTPF